MVVVSYSMVVLTAVYTFQFQVVAGFFKETLKNGYTMWAWSHSTRLSCLLRSCCLLPAALPLACILQCHFFNEDFLKPTSLYNSPVKWKGTSDRLRPAGEEETAQNFANEASSSNWKAEKSGRPGRKASAGWRYRFPRGPACRCSGLLSRVAKNPGPSRQTVDSLKQ
ncbi:piezo-type mechanosensitive ion channel component 1-like isoform X2 [Neophocaena asiaeorientalis asiaeorientalis]|uniref:Piezo-type mechanosensitive ion channel component 1-like isoform X2 n=1 Tax=Neophocaena asiaeorientalis asiaeorientalis TaxID=1706337 RepID=A0A341BTV6_NEOAA|nr:piezo-type mechanosensitive ion channel component 1-like isoform X2 [Neophocaena asiaeorientalis asiaeorientalis]